MRLRNRVLTAVLLLFLGWLPASRAGADVLELPPELEVIESEAFFGDTGLYEVVFPDSLQVIGERAFMNSSLREAVIPASVIEIGEDAFAGLPESAVLKVMEGSAAEAYFMEQDPVYTVQVIAAEDDRIYWNEYEFEWNLLEEDSSKAVITITGLNPNSTLTGLKFNRTYYSWEVASLVIDENAFMDCTQLTEAPVFPDFLTEIRAGAFDGCSQMHGKLVLPDSLQTIGASAFRGCSGLTGVRFSNGLKTIGGEAFQACTGITSLTLPEGLEIIEYNAFSGCSGVTGSLVIPDSVTRIDGAAFENCGFNGTLQLGTGLTGIANHVFSGCHFVGNLQIPDSVTSIGEFAFGSFSQDSSSGTAEAITGPGQFTGSLRIGSSVETIGDGAFGGCGFTGSLTIPGAVTEIGDGAFAGLENMKGSLTLGKNLQVIQPYAFYRCGFRGNLTIPDSVEAIGRSAFRHCSGFNGTLVIGSSAFANLPSNMNNAQTIRQWTFQGCSGIRTLLLEDGAVSIPGEAFADCTSLRTVELPSTLKYIEGFAFANCTSLTNLRIPESLYMLWPSVFSGCRSLSGILDLSSLKDDSLYGRTFENCTSLMGVIVEKATFKSLSTETGPFVGTSPWFTIYCPSPESQTAQAAENAGYRWSVSGIGYGYGFPHGEMEYSEEFSFRGIYRSAHVILNIRAVLKKADGTVLKTVVLPVGEKSVQFSILNAEFQIEELPVGDYLFTAELNTENQPSVWWNYTMTRFTIIPSTERIWCDRSDDLPRGLLVMGEGFTTKAVLHANRTIREIHVLLTRDETNIWDYTLDVGAREIQMAEVLEDLDLSNRNAGTYQVRVEVFLGEAETAHLRSSEFSVFELDGTLDEKLARSIVLWCQNPANRDVFDEADSNAFMNRLTNWDVAAIILCNYTDINMDRLISWAKGQEGDGHVIQLYKAALYNMVKDLSSHIPEIASASDIMPFQDYIVKELKDFKAVSNHSLNEVQDAYDSYSRYLQREKNVRKESADAAEKLFFSNELEYVKELKDVLEDLGKVMDVVSFGQDVIDIFLKAQMDYHNGLFVLQNLRDAYGDDPSVEFINALSEVIMEYSSKEMIYLTEAVKMLESKLSEKAEEVIVDGLLTGVEALLGESVSSISLTYGIVKFAVDQGIAPFFQETSDQDMEFLSAFNLLRTSELAYIAAFDDVYENGGSQTSERLTRVYSTFLATRYAISKCYTAMEAMAKRDGDTDLANELETKRLRFISLSIN